jgi:hypothetical protein
MRGTYGVRIGYVGKSIDLGPTLMMRGSTVTYVMTIVSRVPRRAAYDLFRAMTQVPPAQREFDSISIVRDSGAVVMEWSRTR